MPSEAQQRELEKLYALRGRLIAEVNELDARLTTLISMYFRPREPMQFSSWVLARLRTVDKIEILREITSALGLRERFGPYLTWARRMNELRNEVAHSYVRSNWEELAPWDNTEDYDDNLRWLQSRTTRKGYESVPAETAHLERAISVFDPAVREQLVLSLAMFSPDGPAHALADYDDEHAAEVAETAAALEQFT